VEREPDLSVVAQAGTLDEACRALAGSVEVDVAVVDLELPDGSGADFIKELRTSNPTTQALVLSALSERGRLARTIEAGAAGILHKSSPIREIVDAIRSLRSGEQLLSHQEVIEALRLVGRERSEAHAAQLMIAKLTSREREVLQALAEGLSDKEIAERLYIGTGTVHAHVTSLLSKLEVRSRLQALVFGVRYGLVEIS
jgi:two-component system nitrate/nitrite response regulator NarL